MFLQKGFFKLCPRNNLHIISPSNNKCNYAQRSPFIISLHKKKCYWIFIKNDVIFKTLGLHKKEMRTMEKKITSNLIPYETFFLKF